MSWHQLLGLILFVIVVAIFCVGAVRRLYRGDRESDRRADKGLQHRDEYSNDNR